MASGNTNFGNDQGTGTVGADGFLGPLTGSVTGDIGGTTPAAGAFTFSSQSVSDALTGTGTTRANALALVSAINVLSTSATGTGCILPDAPIGSVVTIYNNGADSSQVYAAGSQTIDGVAGATGVPLTEALRAQYTRTTALKWLSAQLGVVSA